MASSSTVLACIQSALDDLAVLMKPPVPAGARALRFQLRNLKTFVLCSRKLVNDERQLGSLLLWIEDVVRRKAREICDDANYSLEMKFLEEEIQDSYITILDRTSSCDDHLMSNGEVLEVMSSIVENLVDIYDWRSSSLHFEMLGEAMEGLREQMAFLRCLVQMSDPGISCTDLIAHSQDVAINAAYLIFTCRADEKRKGTIKFNISCLVQKIEPVDPQVYEIYTQVLRSSQGMDVTKLLLDSLIYILWDILLQLNTPHLVPMELQLQQLYEGLRLIKAAVVEGEMEEYTGLVVCEAGVLICSLYQSHTDLPLQDLLESIKSENMTSYGDEPAAAAASGIQTLLGENMESTCNEHDEECGEVHRTYSPLLFTVTNEIVGHRDEISSLRDQLCRGSSNLQIISIVGMPGIGKTTLASRVYNDASVSNYFHCRACCNVTQVVDKRKVLLQILEQNAPMERFEETESEEYLESELWRRLKGRRYLIFLDDVWSTKVWESLKGSFPNNGNGSRIILTSRSCDVAPRDMLAQHQPHIVRELSSEESMELLQMKLFPWQREWPSRVKDFAIPFVDICRGLPLMVVLVAGILIRTKAESWKTTLDCLISDKFLGDPVLLSTFDLSYEHLPDYLKWCFLYFAAFPRDGEVSVQRLLRLWIAEGFVQKDLVGTLEDVAQSYLHDLINRSFVEVSKRRSDGGIKACRIHGLYHEYCLRKARGGKFFHYLNGFDELSAFSEQPDLWRLSVESKPQHFKESKLFCPRAGSLLLNYSQQTKTVEAEEEFFLDISFLIRTFKFLHVLDIEKINVGHVFPSELEVLVQLAFVAVRGEMRQIQPSIAKLSKLETLIVDAGPEVVALPDSLGSMLNLQFLHIKSSRSSGGASLPAANFENSRALDGLETFYGVVVPSWGILASLMRNYPNIRKLKCRRAMDDTENAYKSVALEFLSQLQSLHLSSLNACLFKFRLPENLTKLTLSGFHLVPKKMTAIGKMPNLEVLKLLDASFEGNTWEMEEGKFMKLRVLKLHSPGLVRWTASDGGFFSLVKLTLEGCTSLQEIPSASLQDCPIVEVIEVYDCSSTVVALVRDIKEAQEQDWGNLVKLIVSDN